MLNILSELSKHYDLFSLGLPPSRVLLATAQLMVAREQLDYYALAAGFIASAFRFAAHVDHT